MTAAASPKFDAAERSGSPRAGAEPFPLRLALSAALHALVAGALLFAPLSSPPVELEATPVEILSAEQFAALAPPPAARLLSPARPVPSVPPRPAEAVAPPLPQSVAPAVSAPVPQAPPRQTIRATTMLSGAVLADARSRASVAFLKSLDADGRLEQLCNIEAMAQIGQHYPDLKPDRVIAYAMADTQIRRDAITASGAALHGREGWTNLSFTCRASPDRRMVVAFEYRVGDPIPRSEWAARNLPARP